MHFSWKLCSNSWIFIQSQLRNLKSIWARSLIRYDHKAQNINSSTITSTATTRKNWIISWSVWKIERKLVLELPQHFIDNQLKLLCVSKRECKQQIQNRSPLSRQNTNNATRELEINENYWERERKSVKKSVEWHSEVAAA